MQDLERLDLYSNVMYNQLKFLVFGDIKRVFRMYAFIQANIFFLKIKTEFNKKMCYILTRAEC